MKVLVLVICIGCVVYISALSLSAAVLARDLGRIAQKERARRDALPASERDKRSFTNAHLESYAWQRRPAKLGARVASPPSQRDFAKEEAFWRQQKMLHDRELARSEARIRRLQSRLAERELAQRRKGWRQDDPTITLIKESLESLREERDKLDLQFRERSRKAGAFPGWNR